MTTMETRLMLEERVADLTVMINERGDTEKDQIKQNWIRERSDLLDKLAAFDKNEIDEVDKKEKRQLERERNEDVTNVEYVKAQITWQRAALEIGKVVLPVVISMVGYNVFQKRVMVYEETGRVTSTAGRELHLPKFMK